MKKLYEVELTVREHFVVNVRAWSPAEARMKALNGTYDRQPTSCGDRETIAARVRKFDVLRVVT